MMLIQRFCFYDGIAFLFLWNIYKECMIYAYNQRNVRKRREGMGISQQ